MTTTIQGIAASPGIAIGPAYIIATERYVPPAEQANRPQEEVERFRQAVAKAAAELEQIRQATLERMGEEKAEIFEAHLLVLEDPDLIEAIEEQIAGEGLKAEYALHQTAQSFVETLRDMDNELLRERAADVEDVAGRIMDALRGRQGSSLASITQPCVIVADDLTPSDTAQLDLNLVQGFVTRVGSRTSHSAIMARSLGVPAVVGAGTQVMEITAGEELIVHAGEGRILVGPDAEERARYVREREQYVARQRELARLKDEPTVTLDEHRVELAANIGNVEDMQQVLDNGAEAIGLFRTEFLYMGRASLPSEEEQYQQYKYVLEKMDGKPVVIRTLDIGGDKELPYMELPEEDNPFLGQRALRLCLAHPELFRTQLRALLRASKHGQLKIMFPMIAVLSELLEAKRILQEEKERLLGEGEAISESIEIGMMIEVPAAALGAAIFAPHVDFFSIGTNDLIQYTMAADRMNEQVSYLYQPCHPTVLRLVKLVIDAAAGHGRWVGMCGEMAGDERAIPLLLGLGLHEFSMSAAAILPARGQLAELNYASCQEWAQEALGLSSEQEVLDLVAARLN
ncbi:phosphoenolpyruvate--protein phosphotransferase [Paenibacillus sp. 598K]|uniref:phosphoenolpyruvate--protein phosphotransferase n=1 Tax=Paenibacillus sp. 598K TaxID=1117987 RepID=UPI000FFAA902|nr:phosphoenolpyruvate--protein phosphotransferase [Paenibacillus sp. 598K]GBF72087.1 phosphoenolpyruvate--protein phosphotransferase [Paenibacillus sp. 598K]